MLFPCRFCYLLRNAPLLPWRSFIRPTPIAGAPRRVRRSRDDMGRWVMAPVVPYDWVVDEHP